MTTAGNLPSPSGIVTTAVILRPLALMDTFVSVKPPDQGAWPYSAFASSPRETLSPYIAAPSGRTRPFFAA